MHVNNAGAAELLKSVYETNNRVHLRFDFQVHSKSGYDIGNWKIKVQTLWINWLEIGLTNVRNWNFIWVGKIRRTVIFQQRNSRHKIIGLAFWNFGNFSNILSPPHSIWMGVVIISAQIWFCMFSLAFLKMWAPWAFVQSFAIPRLLVILGYIL